MNALSNSKSNFIINYIKNIKLVTKINELNVYL